MSSETLGISTSEVEVTGISSHGVWLLAGEEEMFLSYEDFPWFRDVSVKEILNVQDQLLVTSIGPTWTWTSVWKSFAILIVFRFELGMMHNPTLQPTANPLRGLPAG